MDLNREQQELQQLATECLDESKKLFLESKLKSAEEMAIRARDLFWQIGDIKNYVEALNKLAIYYAALGNESLEVECLLDGMEYAYENGYHDLMATLLNNIGSKYQSINANDQALYYYEEAVKAYEVALQDDSDNMDPDDVSSFTMVVNMNLCELYCIKGEHEKARAHYDIAKRESVNPANERYFFSFQSFEGLTLWRLGEKDAAISLADSIIQSSIDTVYTSDYLQVMSDLMTLLKEMGDYDKWVQILSLMESRLDDSDGLYMHMELLARWLDYYHTIGDEASYQRCCIEYLELSQKKVLEDERNRAATIDLKIKIRRTERAKRHSDEIVYLDPLTGIGNRNRMLEDSVTYIQDSIATGIPITIGLIDIDFFKECNDTYGHVEGDECLKKVASVMNDAVGTLGNVYRYGGDEFLILLPQASVEEIEEVGAKIKEGVAKLEIPNRKSPIVPFVTVSQGYTRALAEEGDTIEHLVDLADHVLYTVKRYGRNGYRFMMFDDVVSSLT